MAELRPEDKQRIEAEERERARVRQHIKQEQQNKSARDTAIGCVVLVVIALLIVWFVFPGSDSDEDSRSERTASPDVTISSESPPAPKLLCRSSDWRWHRSRGGSHAIAEGRVKNISDKPLDAVEVVVQFEAGDGTFISSASALIDYQPVMPGQTSPWEALTGWNPQMSRAQVAFKYLSGGTILTKREQ